MSSSLELNWLIYSRESMRWGCATRISSRTILWLTLRMETIRSIWLISEIQNLIWISKPSSISQIMPKVDFKVTPYLPQKMWSLETPTAEETTSSRWSTLSHTSSTLISIGSAARSTRKPQISSISKTVKSFWAPLNFSQMTSRCSRQSLRKPIKLVSLKSQIMEKSNSCWRSFFSTRIWAHKTHTHGSTLQMINRTWKIFQKKWSRQKTICAMQIIARMDKVCSQSGRWLTETILMLEQWNNL